MWEPVKFIAFGAFAGVVFFAWIVGFVFQVTTGIPASTDTGRTFAFVVSAGGGGYLGYRFWAKHVKR